MHNLELSKLNSPQSEALTEQEMLDVNGGFVGSIVGELFGGGDEVSTSQDTSVDGSKDIQNVLNDRVDNSNSFSNGSTTINADPGVVNF